MYNYEILKEIAFDRISIIMIVGLEKACCKLTAQSAEKREL